MSEALNQIGALLSCAQQHKRNADRMRPDSYVRDRRGHRDSGREIARIVAEHKLRRVISRR